MKYIYGPVNSRRLGFSLGISLTPYKLCSFDCVYCQLGKTTKKTIERKEYIDIKEIVLEFKLWLAANSAKINELNYITFSGMGEPTLNTRIGQLILEIKSLVSVPVAVITNSCFLSDPLLRKEIITSDLIVPSLDAVTQDVFEKIDRPDKKINLESIIQGLIDLRKEYSGQIWLEVMLVKGVNEDLTHINKLREIIKKINPDKVHLNSPVRLTAECDVVSVERARLEEIKGILGDKCEIV